MVSEGALEVVVAQSAMVDTTSMDGIQLLTAFDRSRLELGVLESLLFGLLTT